MTVSVPSSSCEICSEPYEDYLLGTAVLWRCPACGHMGRDLQAAPAHHRDLAYGGEPTLDNWRLSLTHRRLLKSHTGPLRQVFEIGFGNGGMLRRFYEGGAQIAGTDPDQLQIDIDPIVSRHARLEKLPIEKVNSSQYQADLVYGIHVIEHVQDPIDTLRKAGELLAPGGTLHMFTPAADWSGLPLVKEGWWMLEDPTHVRFFSPRSLHLAVQAAGLQVQSLERPLLDSLVHDSASMLRMWPQWQGGAGVLAQRSAFVVAAGLLPFTLTARMMRPKFRPVLHVVAVKEPI